MDRMRGFPDAPDASRSVEDAIAEADGAISLVLSGVARTVQLYGIRGAEAATGVAAAHAQRARVAFRVERDRRGGVTLIVGPRLNG